MMRHVLGYGIALLLLAAVIAAVHVRLTVVGPRTDRVRAEVAEPVLDLLRHPPDPAALRQAYDRLTSAGYRERFPFEAYLRHHQTVADQYGLLVSAEQSTDSSPFFEKGQSYQLFYWLNFERGKERVALEVAATPDGYRLCGAHTESVPDQLVPSPW